MSDSDGELVTTAAGTNSAWPDGMEMIRQVREAAGLFAGAMPITPKQAWEEALERVRRLRGQAADSPHAACRLCGGEISSASFVVEADNGYVYQRLLVTCAACGCSVLVGRRESKGHLSDFFRGQAV